MALQRRDDSATAIRVHAVTSPDVSTVSIGSFYPDDILTPSTAAGVVLAEERVWDWVVDRQPLLLAALHLHETHLEHARPDTWVVGEYEVIGGGVRLTVTTRTAAAQTSMATSLLTIDSARPGSVSA